MQVAANTARGYLALFALALRLTPNTRANLIGRILFYCVLVLVFSRLWQAIFADYGQGLALSAHDCVWYLAITEWVTLALPRHHQDMEAEIRSGEVASQLLRPQNYTGARISQALGDLYLRLLVIGLAGLCLTYVFTGQLPSTPRALWLVVPLGFLGATLMLLIQTLIGLSAFWLNDVSPTYWVFQKLNFILGGVILPLDIYPHWLQEVARHSPFAAAHYHVGQLVLQDVQSTALLQLTATLLAWLALATGALVWTHRAAMQRVQIHGG